MSAPKRNKPKPRGTLGDRLLPKRTHNRFLQHPQVGSLEKARQRILDYGADEEFEKLVGTNCEPGFLLIFLGNVAEDGPALDTWQARFGVLDSRQLRSILKRMLQCAEEFERLDRAGLLRLAAWPRFKREFSPTEFLDRLSRTPTVLRACADVVQAAATNPRFKPRAHGFSNTALAQLVAYVEHCTGVPHDSEVSALVNAVRQTEEDQAFTADALKTWRAEHTDLIRHSAQLFPSLFGR